MNDLFDSKVVLSISKIETTVNDKEKLSKLIYCDKQSLNDYISNIDSYIYAHLILPIQLEERKKIINNMIDFINVLLVPLIKEDVLYFYKIDFVLLLLKNSDLINYEFKKQIDKSSLLSILIKIYNQSLKKQENKIKLICLNNLDNKELLFYLKEYYRINNNNIFILDIYERANKELKRLMINDDVLKFLFNH